MAFFATVSAIVMLGIVGFLVWCLLRGIQDEKRSSGIRKVWKDFGLSLVLLLLFLVSWGTQGLSQWDAFRNEQRDHGQPVEVGEYIVDFSRATLENWQSEFLQLFSFVVLAALYIHRGSGESKDSNDRMEQMLKEIKEKLDV